VANRLSPKFRIIKFSAFCFKEKISGSSWAALQSPGDFYVINQANGYCPEWHR
jgi:hypothetical protein